MIFFAAYSPESLMRPRHFARSCAICSHDSVGMLKSLREVRGGQDAPRVISSLLCLGWVCLTVPLHRISYKVRFTTIFTRIHTTYSNNFTQTLKKKKKTKKTKKHSHLFVSATVGHNMGGNCTVL